MNKHLWKVILPFIMTASLYDFTRQLAPGRNTFILCLISGVISGGILGLIFDYKRARRIEIKEFNKNIKQIKKQGFSNDNRESSIVLELEKLSVLKEKNVISEDEFIKLKNDILKSSYSNK